MSVLADPTIYEFTGGDPPGEDELRCRYEAWSAGRSPDGTQLWLNWIVGSEAARAPVAWLRRHDVERVTAHVHPQHAASQRVAARAGLEATGVTHDGEQRWETLFGPARTAGPRSVGAMSDRDDFNARVIAEFRENDGRVGGPFEGAPMVLVHHRGARTGTERVTPLMYRPDGDRAYVFASAAGAPDHPAWYHNLMAHPDTSAELPGDGEVPVRITELTGAERDRVWDAQKADYPQFAEYEAATDRTIPVLALDRS